MKRYIITTGTVTYAIKGRDLLRRKGKGKYSCAQNKPTLIGFADKGRLAVYINAC